VGDAKPRTCRASDRVHEERSAGELGITQAEAHVLTELHRHGPTQIATLHREFGHKRSTLTSVLDRLERRKLIRRELNPDDRRSFVIRLRNARPALGTRAASRVTDALDELERSRRRALDSNELRSPANCHGSNRCCKSRPRCVFARSALAVRRAVTSLCLPRADQSNSIGCSSRSSVTRCFSAGTYASKAQLA
jgi:DNA-binding MarR family transcriptional regulator